MNDGTTAEAVISQYFASRHEQALLWDQGSNRAEPALDTWERWLQHREIDPVTALQLRIWSANRALAVLNQGHPDARRFLEERLLLGQWLADHGHHRLDPPATV